MVKPAKDLRQGFKQVAKRQFFFWFQGFKQECMNSTLKHSKISQAITPNISLCPTLKSYIYQILQAVTWIDSPNGGHEETLKRSLIGPNEVTLKKLVYAM